jgi:uncharacterized protein with PIN domain
MCWFYNDNKPNSVCPKCGEPTYSEVEPVYDPETGERVEQLVYKSITRCPYSPLRCEFCGDSPCDGSC